MGYDQMTARRYLEIAKRYRPARCKVRFRRGSEIVPAHAVIHADGSREIYVPRPVTRDALFVYLHECGHLFLGHCSPGYSEPLWKQEYEAEQWATSIMRLEGVSVSRKMLNMAKSYVRECIRQDRKEGRPLPPYRVRRWCKV